MKKAKQAYNFYVEIKTCSFINDSTDLPCKEWYALVKARNHEIVFTGETRKRKSALIKTINHLFPNVVIKNQPK